MQNLWTRYNKHLVGYFLIIAAVVFYGALPLLYGFGLYQIIGRVEGVSQPMRWSIVLIFGSLIALYMHFGKDPDRISGIYLPGILLFLIGLIGNFLQDSGYY